MWTLSDLERRDFISNFDLLFQPIVSIERDSDGSQEKYRCNSLEALIRVEGESGFHIPHSLMLALDDRRYARKIGLAVLTRALYCLSNWVYQGYSWKLSVNISPAYLMAPEFLFDIKNLLSAYAEVPRDLITLELTESAPIENLQSASSVIEVCREMGLHITLDDYGTGFSTRAWLERLPVHGVKLDRSFISSAKSENCDFSFVNEVVELARKGELGVVVEGVETEEQLETALSLGCTAIQGFYFSQPLMEQDLRSWMQGFDIRQSANSSQEIFEYAL